MIENHLLDIKRIAIDTVPNKEWLKISVTALMVDTYLEFDSQYVLSDNNQWTTFDIFDLEYVNENVDKNDVTEVLQKLRTDIYQKNPSRGAFYSVRVEINKDTASILYVDYDNKPTFEGDVPDDWFVKDLRLYPRDAKYIPEWLSAML